MFTTAERASLRDDLVAAARVDHRICAAAFVGSFAAEREDRWSDIDLALRLAPGLNPAEVIEPWTRTMYGQHDAIMHVDLWSGPTLFRVFLLRSSLQIDLSLWPSEEFAQHGGPFQLIFGQANDADPPLRRSRQALIGMAWLHALHARSSIARGRELQALYMLNGMRDQIISLACLRHDLSPDQGRGADQLPATLREQLLQTIVRSTETNELVRAFGQLIDVLDAEIGKSAGDTVDRLRPVLLELVRTSNSDEL